MLNEDGEICFTKEAAQAIIDRYDSTHSTNPLDYIDIDPDAEHFLRALRAADQADISRN